MNIEVLVDTDSVAEKAASIIAEYASKATAARGLFILAVRGGHTPWIMMRWLAAAQIPWRAVHEVQVDERAAPAGHEDGRGRSGQQLLADCAAAPGRRIGAGGTVCA